MQRAVSHSRMLFVRFFVGQTQSLFLQGHQHAFDFFGGVPRIVLYDNLKSAVLERIGDSIRFHPILWDFASHYGFEPRPVAVARGNEKGRVERAIRYLRTSFFPARTWKDLADLNAQALRFCENEAARRRCPGDRTLTVQAAWHNEKPLLRPICPGTFSNPGTRRSPRGQDSLCPLRQERLLDSPHRCPSYLNRLCLG